MLCFKCGTEYENAKFCPECGSPADPNLFIEQNRKDDNQQRHKQLFNSAHNLTNQQVQKTNDRSWSSKNEYKHNQNFGKFFSFLFKILLSLFAVAIVIGIIYMANHYELTNKISGLISDNTKAIEVSNEAVTENKTQAPTTESAKNEQQYKDSCKSINYKDIARNPANYENFYVKFRGQVSQVIESGYGLVVYRINVTKGEYSIWTDTVYVTYYLPSGSPRILDDDIVTFYGLCTGVESYQTVLGATVTIPAVTAKYIDIDL